MKKLFTILLMLTCLGSGATTYYFSASGNDANNGTSTATPWQTLAKFNSSFASFLSGDRVLFNRGDVFYGSITANKNFTTGNPLIISSYGTGANPIITGLTNVTAWTNLGGNIWESTSAVTSLTTLNMVVINGVNTAMGRFPNTGYLVYQSHSGNTTITSSSLNSATTNWTGAEVVLRSTPWLLQRQPISAHSGGTLTYTGAETPRDGYGFFIQNDARTLDAVNEWYFVSSTKKLRIYNTVMPTNVSVSSVDEVVLNTAANWVTYDHIDFKGANTNIFETRNSQHVVATNCSFLFAGRTAIMSNNASSANGILTIDGNLISDNNESAIKILSFTDNFLVQNNSINNTGMIPGAGNPSDQQNTADAIDVNGLGSIIQNNIISNTGHIGIAIRQKSNITAQNNYLTNWGQVRYDVGAVYSWNPDTLSITSRFILGNICINNVIPIEGIGTADPIITGIYLDGSSKNTTISGNTVSNCISEGIHILGSGSVKITGNTCFNNGNLVSYSLPNGSALGMLHFTSASGETINNLTVKNNIFFAKNANQFCFFYRNDDGTFNYGLADSNYYARPIDDNLTLRTTVSFSNTQRTLAQWKTFSGQDAHSNASPKAVTSTDSLRFEYNNTSAPKTVTLDANYIDIKGAAYNGSITLAPNSSAVLIFVSNLTANISPVANAGTDSTITLPQSSVHLLGSGTDADGTIASYLWSKVSGPGSTTLATPTNQNTIASNLQAGTYVFQLRVTDNLGATGTDNVTVIVNAANIPPTANAGADQSITLPTSTATLTGTDSDADGTIASRAWTQLSGPNTATMAAATSATNGLSGLIQGTYSFQYTVTDNLGATAADITQLIVNPPGNVPPTADAGVDQFISVSSTTLTGTGSDTDGTIASYAWSLVSGPNTPTIVSASSAATSVTGMINGTYSFRLTVTDNMGATASAIVHVSVTIAGPVINLIILHKTVVL